MSPDSKDASTRPAAIFPAADQVPEELRPLKCWIGFRYRWNGHKWQKPPHSPLTGEAIGATEEHEGHFVAFAEAVAGDGARARALKLGGVGFVFTAKDGFVGIDFDDCRDAATGAVNSAVEEWLKWFPSYTEVSPSGTGIHVIARGKIPKGLTATAVPGANGATVEMYASGRYFTFSGNRVGERTSVADCQTGIDKLLLALGKAAAKDAETGTRDQGRAMSKSTARKIHAGNLEALRHAAQGEGNALLNTAAFFAGRASAAGALDETENQIKAELLKIVTTEWTKPHDERGARATIESGWTSGAAAGPIRIGEDGIVTNPGHVVEMIKRSEEVLHAMGLKYFERNHELVHTAYGRDIPEVAGYKRDGDSVVIRRASAETILRDLDSRVKYVTLRRKGEVVSVSRTHAPDRLPKQLHDRVAVEVRDVPFPTLNMVTASPVLLPSGAISRDLFAEGVLFVPRNRNLYPQIPDRPTKAEAMTAMRQFWDVFAGFPFVDPDPGNTRKASETASYSATLAGVLSLVARPYIGPEAVPLFGVHAPAPRSGKTKIAKTVTAAALGYLPSTTHFADEIEFGKHLQPLMRAGDRAILIDNVERILQGSKLCVLITENVLKDRVLCESRDVVLRNTAVLFATGNNLVIGGDLAARALRIDINPNVERPEERPFDFDPVSRAVERHPQLVTAAALALRAYILAGAPWDSGREPWGGFEKWDRLVSGCLRWLGYVDPCGTRSRVGESDPVRTANAGLLEDWFARYGEREVSLREIQKEGKEKENEVYNGLLKEGQWDGYHAQWILRKMEGKVVGGLRLERVEGRSRFRVVGRGAGDPGLRPVAENGGPLVQPGRGADASGVPF